MKGGSRNSVRPPFPNITIQNEENRRFGTAVRTREDHPQWRLKALAEEEDYCIQRLSTLPRHSDAQSQKSTMGVTFDDESWIGNTDIEAQLQIDGIRKLKWADEASEGL